MRHGRLNSLFQVALYLPSYAQARYIKEQAEKRVIEAAEKAAAAAKKLADEAAGTGGPRS